MFCPLCQAEYRDGARDCANCRVGLVPSREEAESAAIRIWKGDTPNSLEKVIAAIDAEGIRYHFKERVSFAPGFKFLGITVSRMKSKFEFEVWVLRSDFARALAVIEISAARHNPGQTLEQP